MSDKLSNFDLFADSQGSNESAALVAQPVDSGPAVCTYEAGAAWYNACSVESRAFWHQVSGSVVPADAYRAYMDTAGLPPVQGQSGIGMQVDLLAVRGRKAVHADGAARVKAHRATKARIDYADDPAIVATLAEIADGLDCSRQQLMASLVRFALTNRNWKQVGLYGRRG